VISENALLREKLQRSEDPFDARSIATRRPDEDAITVREMVVDEDDAMTIRGSGLGQNSTVQSVASNLDEGVITFAFENILEQSYVYKKSARFPDCDRSFASTAYRSHAWSVFTGYSLADISVLSVIAMPLTASDIENGQHYRSEYNKNDKNQDEATRGDNEISTHPGENRNPHTDEPAASNKIDFLVKVCPTFDDRQCLGCSKVCCLITDATRIVSDFRN